MRNCIYLIFFALVLLPISCRTDKPDMVARLGNEMVTSAELQHWMLLEKANVYNYFYRKYKVDDSELFWIQRLGDEIPIEVLKNRALEKAKKCKVQQILALEKGIITTANFYEIVEEMDDINSERKLKVESGEPIYGPIQFTTRTYFFHVFDKMVIALKSELAKEELKPDPQKLHKMQETARQVSGDKTGFLTMQYVDDNYDTFIDSLTRAAKFELNKEAYAKVKLE